MRSWVPPLVAALGLASAPASADAGSWSVQPVPSPPGATFTSLEDVSCASKRACVAVGYFRSLEGAFPLAVHWDGSTWTVQSTPSPPNHFGAYLLGVSCSAPRACTAVGQHFNAVGRSRTLVERWDGSRWTIQSSPSPPDASLNDVSCPTRRACVAVGRYAIRSEEPLTLVERWDDSAWAVDPTPAIGGTFLDVSCTRPRECTAVGGNKPFGLAARSGDAGWAVQPVPIRPGATVSVLHGVSCPARRACTAVGAHSASEVFFSLTLAVRWDGTSWAIQPTQDPDPGATALRFLFSVSCPTRDTCTAVGSNSVFEGDTFTLAERWNGTTWELQPAPTADFRGILRGVSCATRATCIAVGSAGASALALGYSADR
jgi:hypothetical protein